MNKKDEKLNTISELDSESKEGQGSQETKPESLDEVKRALAAKTDEAQTLQDKYLRLAAEFENYKKLAQRDQREYSRFANESILKELLPIVDNLERALRCSKDDQGRDGFIQGVELTLKQFLEALAKFGVRQIASVGETFDPGRHQAVARVESTTAPDNTVAEEHQKGYLLHERILRPAMVTVTGTPAAVTPDAAESSQGSDEAPIDAAN
ncbi:MAG: nucleotide exchange factor GrpE [Nitrospirae bacterium]|nr:nucleotide exchange factor GrpE [Nitrospirota bacterium]